MDKVFFDTWDSLGRTAIVAFFSYLSLILMLRVAGSRTLSQLNAFDLIITVAIGSTLSTIILNKDITLADGVLALALLILFQFIVSKLSVNIKSVRQIIKTEPRVLFYQGRYIPAALRDCRITEYEVMQMVRSEGGASMEEIAAVVLESNGRFSVIKNINGDRVTALKNVKFESSKSE